MWANIHQVVSSDFQQLHQKMDVLNAWIEHQPAQTLKQHQCRHFSLHQGYFIPMLSFIPLWKKCTSHMRPSRWICSGLRPGTGSAKLHVIGQRRSKGMSGRLKLRCPQTWSGQSLLVFDFLTTFLFEPKIPGSVSTHSCFLLASFPDSWCDAPPWMHMQCKVESQGSSCLLQRQEVDEAMLVWKEDKVFGASGRQSGATIFCDVDCMFFAFCCLRWAIYKYLFTFIYWNLGEQISVYMNVFIDIHI